MDPSIVLSYVAVANGPETLDFCSRFVGSWIVNPPGANLDLVVACNGGALSMETALLFAPLTPKFLIRKNDDGWDISAHQDVARKFKCEMLVCFGQSVYFNKPNWLVPMVNAWKKYGPGMYGFLSSFLVRPHLNTTCFVCDPKFLMGWPQVTNHADRYRFEHGRYAFWNRMAEFKKPAKLVTWDGVYDHDQWRYPKNILWRGDQSNCLIRANHMDRFDAADPSTKYRWSEAADGRKMK